MSPTNDDFIIRFLPAYANIDLKSCILILPSLGIANIGQLAIDLMCHSCSLHRAGYGYSKHLVPISGYDENEGITSMIEFYTNEKRNIFVLQLRSSVRMGHWQAFCDNLSRFINESEFKMTYVLSGADSSLLLNPSDSDKYHHFSNNLGKEYIPEGFIEVDEKKTFVTAEPEGNIEHEWSCTRPIVPGGGILRRLDLKTPMIGILKMVDEGENIKDAVEVALKVSEMVGLTGLDPSGIKLPSSWQRTFIDDEATSREIYM